MYRIAVGLLSLFVAATLAEPVLAADARKGETLAKRWCATCHVVASDQQRGTAQSPPFSAIAKKPGFNEAIARVLLADTASANAGYEPVAQRSGRPRSLYRDAEVTP